MKRVRESVTAIVLGLMLPVSLLLASPAGARAAGSPIRWGAPRAIDASAPFGNPAVPARTSCPTSTECIAVASGGWVLTTSNPAAGSEAWHGTARIDGREDLAAVSCPSASLCVLTDHDGNAFFSTNPTGPAAAWKRVVLAGHPNLGDVSCPSTSLCVLLDENGGVWTSTQAAGGVGTWRHTTLPATKSGLDPQVISCASTAECVVVGDEGYVVSSTSPTGGGTSWKLDGQISPDTFPQALTCASVSLCLLATNVGTIVTSTTATGPASSWTTTTLVSDGSINSIACTSATACVAVDSEGSVHASTNPAGGSAAWTIPVTKADTDGLAALACAPSGVCVATDDHGRIETSPAFAPGTVVAGDTSLQGISCASPKLCVAVDNAGNVLSTRSPAGGWSTAPVLPGGAWDAVSCPTASFCTASGPDSEVATSSHPAGPASTWEPVDLGLHGLADSDDGPIELDGIDCPTASLCVASDLDRGPLSTTDPTGGKGVWNVDRLGNLNAAFASLSPSCPTANLCFIVPSGDGAHGISYTHNPGSPHPTWRTIELPDAQDLVAIACPTTSACIAVDGNGELLVSRKPTTRSWKHVRIDGPRPGLVGISCGSAKLCVVVDGDGNVFSSASPAAGTSNGWHKTVVDPGDAKPTAVSCAPPKGPCVIVDSGGNVVVGR